MATLGIAHLLLGFLITKTCLDFSCFNWHSALRHYQPLLESLLCFRLSKRGLPLPCYLWQARPKNRMDNKSSVCSLHTGDPIRLSLIDLSTPPPGNVSLKYQAQCAYWQCPRLQAKLVCTQRALGAVGTKCSFGGRGEAEAGWETPLSSPG